MNKQATLLLLTGYILLEEKPKGYLFFLLKSFLVGEKNGRPVAATWFRE